jgi:uncharacterized protein with GYD domain
MLAEMGGKVESFYYALGEDDGYVIVELSDDISAAAVGLRVNASLVRISITVLLTPAEIDQTAKKSVSYRAPGKTTNHRMLLNKLSFSIVCDD